MGRRKEREQAFFMIFEDMFAPSEENTIDIFSENVEPAGEFAKMLYNGVKDNKEDLDACIVKYLNGWKITRLSKIIHSLLLLSFYEIKYVDDVPVSVSINEAVELAKTYSGKEEASFINGVLGSFSRSFK